MSHRYNFNRKPPANPKAIIQGEKYRLTVLLDGVLRYEWAEDGQFEDRASTFALFRDLPVPDFKLVETETSVEITTKLMHVYYDKKEFSASGFMVTCKEFTWGEGKWYYGAGVDDYNLRGTTRTLDNVNGRTDLDPGVVSVNGWAELDDSSSLLFTSDGWIEPRRKPVPGTKREDVYLFAYGHRFKQALKAFYEISGKEPLLPRYAFGNWWSRYHKYSADEYLAVMDRFKEEKIPFSVAVIDMDWHLVEEVDPKDGHGWTGYTWSKTLFPDPPAFLKALKDRNLASTLNLHPADGVRHFEEAYPEMCKALGRDAEKGDAIPFEPENRGFMDAYFDILHRRLEKDGVDFWWIDWQQRLGLAEPLWILNHYHYLDSALDGKRPISFSRYAGPGSHRYPVGFSGDTVISWESLEFQPEFTATASNIGFSLWSHDIGGHFFGRKNDELYTRWVQLGVWSPILRLHSSLNPFLTKEPWVFGEEARRIATNALRFRHRLIPYLYSMNYLSATQGEGLIQPIYWSHPAENPWKVSRQGKQEKEQFDFCYKNQFTFGTELMICSITSPRDKVTLMSEVKAWLPPGTWVDLNSGLVYDGDRETTLHRNLDEYPVFARPGSIIPLDAAKDIENGGNNPNELEIVVVVGKSGKFELKEDDGKGTINSVQTRTSTVIYDHDTGLIRIDDASPNPRSWSVRLLGFWDRTDIKEEAGLKITSEPNGLVIRLPEVATELQIAKKAELGILDVKPLIYKIIDSAQASFENKKKLWTTVNHDKLSLPTKLSRIAAEDTDEGGSLGKAIVELLLADQRSGIVAK